MNTKSLINKLAFKSNFSKDQSSEALNFIFDVIKSELIDHRSINIEEFAQFEVKHRKMQESIDKKRKIKILHPPKDKIIFKSVLNTDE